MKRTDQRKHTNPMETAGDDAAQRRRMLAVGIVAALVLVGGGVFVAIKYLGKHASAQPAAKPEILPVKQGFERVGPEMVKIPGGVFRMGRSQADMEDATPVHPVRVGAFWMDVTPVTNAQFKKFVDETGYKTYAEQTPKAEDFPGAPPENLVAGSIVFTPPDHDVPLNNHLVWWSYVKGANWMHPEGPESNIEKRMDHPVVHVCYFDVVEYCKWRSKKEGRIVRPPTEAEWEFAARSGLDQANFTWGNDLKPEGKWVANIFQGKFPNRNANEDGFERTSPVTAFPPNAYGLYDMGGNVWQWCSDWYRPDTYEMRAGRGVVDNPTGPNDSFDPMEPTARFKRVQRGGSFLCSDQFCSRYKVGTRGKGSIDSGSSHVSFRCVVAE